MNASSMPWIQIDDALTLEGIGRFRGTNLHPTRERPPWCVAFFVLQGQRTVRLLGQSFDVKPGEFCILPSEIPHYGVSLDTHDAFFFHFCAKNSVIPQRSSIQTDHICLPVVGPCPMDIDSLRFMEYINNQHILPYCSDHFVITQIRALLYQMSLHAQKTSLWCSDQRSLIAEKVMHFLQNSLSNPVTCRDYEQEFKYTYKYLNSCFSERYGTTIKQMQIRLRIEQARTLLSAGYSIKETVYMSGFTDYHFFLKCFHERVGLTPREFCNRIFRNSDSQ